MALILYATNLCHADEIVPNPSFAEGDTQPVGWQVDSGVGDWEIVDGDDVLVSRGSDTQTSFWRSDPVGFVPGALYRLRFRARRLHGGGGGTVMSGTAFANRDLGQIDTQWQRFSSYFATPQSLGERDWLRFGQWHLPGAIAFDDLRLDRVYAVHRRIGDNIWLGEGEQIAAGRYLFRAPQRTALANHSRPLVAHQAGFNTFRWVFGAGEWVSYRHTIDGARQRQARISVNVNYHTGGQLLVEARTDSTASWTRVGEIDSASSATFDLPIALLPAVSVDVRLRAAAPVAPFGTEGAGSFQVDDYGYEAELIGAVPEGVGHTHLVAVIGDPKAVEQVRIVDTGRLQPGVEDTIAIELGNWLRGETSLRARAAVTANEEVAAVPGQSMPVPTAGIVELPYRLTGTGDRVLHVQLAGEDGSRWQAELDVHFSVLHADDYGQLLATSAASDVWWAASGWKVSGTRQAPTAKGAAVRIEAARNEAEAAQLVLRPHRELRDLVVQVTDLQGPEGGQIDAGSIDVLRVATVPVRQPTDLAGEVAHWPDPLLPLIGAMGAQAGRNLSLWVRVTTPRGIPAGLYRGVVNLRAEGWSEQVDLQVEVFAITLPDRMTCQTAFGFNPGNVWRYHRLETDADRRAVLALYLQSFARHHISPYDPAPLDHPEVEWTALNGAALAADASMEPSIDWRAWDAAMTEAIDEHHFNSFRLSIPGMGGGSYIDRDEPELQGWTASTPQYQALFRGYGRALQRHLIERGWLDEAFVYWFDEPAPRDYDFVMGGFRRLQDAAPEITRMLTEQVETELLGGPNLWCPVTTNFDMDRADMRRARGERFWWYICTVPKTPWAGLFIDHAATELRVWLWQTWQREIGGILVWASNYWTSGAAYPGSLQNPYVDPMSWESTYNAPVGTRRPWGNGDGRFIYPPPAVFVGDGPVLQGPVESIRWEMLRDGIEDYEYLVMLRRALAEKGAQLSAEEHDRMSALLRVPEQISASMTRFTEDPAPIERHRRAVAEALGTLLRQ